ncbi:helix-turn-helix protein [Microbacterium sp. SLBN-146]|nr:helix-turn-helix protein [Microbacterium sp. SLBN-146]
MSPATDSAAWADFSSALGRRLQEARHDLNLTQEQVASASGISTFTYQKLENGESNPGTPANPRLHTIASLAKVLKIDIGDLVSPPPDEATAPDRRRAEV